MQRLIRICLFLFIAFFTEKVESLTCLSCEQYAHPRFCRVVAECVVGEVCYSKTVVGTDGFRTFTMGCTAVSHPEVCNATAQTSLHCQECCTTNLCNAKLCGEKGYPVQRGPICYKCRSRLVGEPCNALQMCQPDEVCSISEELVFSEHIYTSGCSQKHICESHTDGFSSTIIGKRRVNYTSMYTEDDFSVGNCHQCCTHDLCNTNCSTARDIDECVSDPCNNGGTCIDGVNTFTCKCPAGFGGNICKTDIDECVSDPCTNNGTCIDGVNTFTCKCPAGFGGNICQDIDECVSDPCNNGGTCIERVNTFTCKCPAGFGGNICQTDIDECVSDPCTNGGTCIDGVNIFTCKCPAGFGGNICQTAYNSCWDLYHTAGIRQTGVYTIVLPHSSTLLQVLCDMTTDGGGWTVFQNRFNGSVDFNQNFSKYEYGFGSLHGEFWQGLQYIHNLTHECNHTELRIDVSRANGSSGHFTFNDFYLSAAPNYSLYFDNSTFRADDLYTHNGKAFSTYDHTNGNRCASYYSSGWWFNKCYAVNLNGEYKTPGYHNNNIESGMIYYPFNKLISLKTSKMMFRGAKRNCY